MEKNPNPIKTILSGLGIAKRRIKIGIAKNVKERHEDVDRGISGDVVLLCEYLIEEAARSENYLHDLFKEHRYTERGKRGSGKTEFFKLTNQQIKQAQNILSSKEMQSNSIGQILWTFVFAFIVYLIISNQ